MNAMRMPGFTAEDSLHISGAQYHMTASKFLAATTDIRPQKYSLEDCRALRSSMRVSVMVAHNWAVKGDWDAFSNSMNILSSTLKDYSKNC